MILIRCITCQSEKSPEAFSLLVRGPKKGVKCSKECQTCSARRRERRQSKNMAKRSQPSDGSTDEANGPLSPMDVEALVEKVRNLDVPIKGFHVRVDTAGSVASDREPAERAQDLADILGEAMLLRWTCVHKSRSSCNKDVQYSFSCSQSAYVDIEIPDKWKAFIEKHACSETPGVIWRRIVQEMSKGLPASEVSIPFTSKSVYYWWHRCTEKDWRLDPDPFVSACEFIKQKGEEYQICDMEIKAEPGTRAFGFYVKDSVELWAKNTQELAMDSTWNTNSGNFELFAAVADADGCGIPLAFLFLSTSKDAASGAKQKVLSRFLGNLKDLSVQPEFTLTDKDWSEINAMAATWPDAKHQLCIWHALRSEKQRMCKNKDTPAPYDVHAARCEFKFIDKDFVPLSQQDVFKDPIPPPPEKPLPRIRLLVDGRPSVLTQSLPKLVLTPAAIARALAPMLPLEPGENTRRDRPLQDTSRIV